MVITISLISLTTIICKMYICVCQAVNEKTINKAIEQGAKTVQDLAEQLAVTKQCGSCLCEVERIIEQQLGPIEYLAQPQQVKKPSPSVRVYR